VGSLALSAVGLLIGYTRTRSGSEWATGDRRRPDPSSYALNNSNNVLRPYQPQTHPQTPLFRAALRFKSSPSSSSQSSNRGIREWGCLERSLSIPRVLLQSTGCTSSFNGVRVLRVILSWMRMRMRMSMGSLLRVRKVLEYQSLGLMADRRDHHSLLPPRRYLPLYLPTQSPPELPFSIDGPPPATPAAAASALYNQRSITHSPFVFLSRIYSGQPTQRRLDQQLRHGI
jgi:hypothetical protein